MKYSVLWALCFNLCLGLAYAHTATDDTRLNAAESLRRVIQTQQDVDVSAEAASAVATAEVVKMDDDVVMASSVASASKAFVPSVAEHPAVVAPPVKLKVQLRQPTVEKTKKSTKATVAAQPSKKPAKTVVIKLPPAKPVAPVLTQRQVLEREVGRERAALRQAKAQLVVARKSGNNKKISRLMNMVRDRELNIQSIEREMVR